MAQQKRLVLATLLALQGIGGAVAADTVEIYGIVDVGYQKQTGTEDRTAIDSGRLQGSRIGFRGNEDLGSGLKALFTLEYGLAVDENAGIGAGDSATRQAYVGLEGAFGLVKAGRLQTEGYEFACKTGPIPGTIMDANAAVGVRTVLDCARNARQNNAIGYSTPKFGGFEFGVNHARVTEGRTAPTATTTGDEDTINVAHLDYKDGAFSAGAIYSIWSKDNSKAADDIKEMGIRARYEFSAANVYGAYQTQKTGNADANKKYAFAVAVPVSAAGRVMAQYAITNMAGGAADTRAWYLAYSHTLSKRTALYAGYQDRKLESDNTSRKTTIAGIRHNF